MLPDKWTGAVNKATKSALMKALHHPRWRASGSRKRYAQFTRVFSQGARPAPPAALAARFGGLAALPVELRPCPRPSCSRSIADIARSRRRITLISAIFLMRTRLWNAYWKSSRSAAQSKSDDAAESTCWITRAALSKTVSEAASYLTQKGAVDATATPVIIRLVNAIGVALSAYWCPRNLRPKAVPVNWRGGAAE